MIRALIAASLVFVTVVSAQPKDKPTEGDKGSAKALLASGLRLYKQNDFLGALAVFKDAYARFPSDRILLNIGTTLIKLDRPAEAANAYQQYLDSSDADPAKKPEAQRTLADLDKRVGIVELTVEPIDAEIQVGGEDWKSAASVKRVRVTPGRITISARREAYKDASTVLDLLAGSTKSATLKLDAIPVATTNPSSTTVIGTSSIGTTYAGPKPRSRIGVIALAHVDPTAPGAAGVVGLVGDVTDRIGVRAAAILGPKFGGYAGASFAIMTTRVRPIIAVAMPFFRSDGWRWSVRGAGGLELAFNRNLSVIAELGVEHLFNPEDSVESSTLFVPALGVSGRL
jgi:hypothetical protein